MTSVLTGVWRLFATAWRMGRRKTMVAVALMVAGAAAMPLMAFGLGRMTEAVVAGRTGEAVVAGAVVASLLIASLTLSHFAHIAYFELADLAQQDFDEQLISVSNGSPGIEHHDRPEQIDHLTVLSQESRQFETGLQALMQAIALSLTMTFTGVLLAVVNPWLLLLPVAAVPPLVTGRLAERIRDRARTATAQPTRAALNLFHQATSATVAGELRVFRLGGELIGRHTRLWDAATRGLWRGEVRATAVHAAGQVIFALGYVGAVLLVVRDAVAGRRGVGDVVLAIVLAVQVNQQVSQAVKLLQDLQRLASAYRRLADLDEAVAAASPQHGTTAPPDRLTAGIRLAGVEFAYPGAEAPVLRDVTLTLPAGSRVAVVGENGAGKTTLVKLLCGLYRPSAGTIQLDGVDLADVPPAEWRHRISVGFQDFVRYEFDVRHVVGLGDLPRVSSEPAVRRALDRAEATSVVDQLPAGLRTQLGKSYADGAELSGGQWQRLALGRAMMRTDPLLLVLDEPASALDPAAEHALFERYAQQAGRVAASSGAITVFVSHRFSTVRMADLIVVLQDGRVVEVGDHATLAAAGGLYAELFNLQVRAYS